MTNEKNTEWYEEIIKEIDKVNEVTETINNLLNELPPTYKATVSVKEENGKVYWVVTIQGFERKFDRSNFEESKVIHNENEVIRDTYGRPMTTKSLSEEAIIKALKSKFKFK